MKKAWVLSYPYAWADAQADLSFCWAHSHFVGFVMSRLISLCTCNDIATMKTAQENHRVRKGLSVSMVKGSSHQTEEILIANFCSNLFGNAAIIAPMPLVVLKDIQHHRLPPCKSNPATGFCIPSHWYLSCLHLPKLGIHIRVWGYACALPHTISVYLDIASVYKDTLTIYLCILVFSVFAHVYSYVHMDS